MENLEAFFTEIYRVGQPNSKFLMKVPHYSYGFAHPFHKRGFSLATFGFFSQTEKERYGDVHFQVDAIRLSWRRTGTTHSLPIRILDRVINFVANAKPAFCERYWCYWVGGFEEIEFSISIKK